jgi:8-oxo-dGTP diphosphatase
VFFRKRNLYIHPYGLLETKNNSLSKEQYGMKFSGRTATAIITFPPDKILLIKRKTVPFKGYWALPGGRVDPGETVEQTIVREVKEETSLAIAVISKVGEYHEQGIQGGFEYDYYPACFRVKIVGGEIKKQESEIEEIKFFSLSELPEVLAFEHAQMVTDFVAIREADAKK